MFNEEQTKKLKIIFNNIWMFSRIEDIDKKKETIESDFIQGISAFIRRDCKLKLPSDERK